MQKHLKSSYLESLMWTRQSSSTEALLLWSFGSSNPKRNTSTVSSNRQGEPAFSVQLRCHMDVTQCLTRLPELICTPGFIFCSDTGRMLSENREVGERRTERNKLYITDMLLMTRFWWSARDPSGQKSTRQRQNTDCNMFSTAVRKIWFTAISTPTFPFLTLLNVKAENQDTAWPIITVFVRRLSELVLCCLPGLGGGGYFINW